MGTVGDGTEHPQQALACFFVGIAAADFVDVDGWCAEDDGFGSHGGRFANEECRGSLHIVHSLDRNMNTIGFQVRRQFR